MAPCQPNIFALLIILLKIAQIRQYGRAVQPFRAGVMKSNNPCEARSPWMKSSAEPRAAVIRTPAAFPQNFSREMCYTPRGIGRFTLVV